MIKNLNEKLSGQEPVNREELFELVNSWGRNDSFDTIIDDYTIVIPTCLQNQCYPLENLDVSQIDDFSFIFYSSPYNGDLSKWNISNAQDFESMFNYSKFNNNSISNWNTSNVVDMSMMFFNANFNSDISNWDVSNCYDFNSTFSACNFDGDISKWNFKMFKHNQFDMDEMFEDNYDFIKKYNNREKIEYDTKNVLSWLQNNKNKMKELNQDSKDEVLDFFKFNNEFEIKHTS